jgi:hypothetical protein
MTPEPSSSVQAMVVMLTRRVRGFVCLLIWRPRPSSRDGRPAAEAARCRRTFETTIFSGLTQPTVVSSPGRPRVRRGKSGLIKVFATDGGHAHDLADSVRR